MKELEYVKTLSEASHAYYNSDKPVMSDNAFDTLYEEFKQVYPYSEYHKVIGAPAILKKFIHSTPMLSLDKAKEPKSLLVWIKRIEAVVPNVSYSISFKLDGLSGKLVYKKGVLTSFSTRGDGKIGEDKTYLIPYLNVPKTLPEAWDCEITGEVILAKNNGVFTKNLRNKASGLVNRQSDLEQTKLLDFVAFNVSSGINLFLESDVDKFLSKVGFATSGSTVVKTLEEIYAYFEKYEELLREEYPYETDGIVITVNQRKNHAEINATSSIEKYPLCAICIKPKSESAETTLRAIQWNMSAQGRLIPKAIFDAVEIQDAKINKCTLDNMLNVVENNLAIGDTIVISRANDVIPHLEENLEKEEGTHVDIPSVCPSCGYDLTTTETGVHLICENTTCPAQKEQTIVKFVETLNPKGLGEATVLKLLENNRIDSIPTLLTLQAKDLTGLDGFKQAKIDTTISAISTLRTLKFNELIDALSIPLVGIKALKKLNIKSYTDFIEFNDPEYAIGKSIINWKGYAPNLDLLNAIMDLVEIEEVNDVQEAGIVVMTGTGPHPRKELQSMVEAKGYSLGKSVTKETTLLLTDNPDGSSSKCVKARKLGIEIKTYEEFL